MLKSQAVITSGEGRLNHEVVNIPGMINGGTRLSIWPHQTQTKLIVQALAR
jgi:hypothetical protein